MSFIIDPYKFAASVPSITTPSDLADIWEWWEPGRESFSDNDPIGTLVGQFAPGTGHNWTASGGNRPTFKASILNGHGVLRFDGSDDQMASVNTNGLTAVHMFVVIKIDADPPAANKNGLWSLSPAALNLYPKLDVTTDVALGDFLNAGAQVITKGVALDQWRVYEVVSTAAAWKFRLDGTLLHTVGGSVAHQSSGSILFGRSGPFDPNMLDGDVAHMSIMSAELSSGDRTAMINYLNNRFGLSAS